MQRADDCPEREQSRRKVFDELRRVLGERVQQLLHFLVTEQLVRVALHDVAQVRRDHCARIDDREAERLRVIASRRLDPHGFHAERRIARLDARQLAEHLAGIDRELALGIDDALAHRHAGEIDAIGIRLQVEVVADVYGLHEEAEILCELAAHAAECEPADRRPAPCRPAARAGNRLRGR